MVIANTPWERERQQALEELRLLERGKALEDIARLMRFHGISIEDIRQFQSSSQHPARQIFAFESHEGHV